jgi:hypothetical protein
MMAEKILVVDDEESIRFTLKASALPLISFSRKTDTKSPLLKTMTMP